MSITKKILKIVRILDEKISGRILTFHSRPLRTLNIDVYSRVRTSPDTIAVVIQGPLLLKKDFTLETVRLYKKTFSPSSKIIVSTWEGEDSETLQKMRDLGVIVLTNKKPTKSGIGHINFQVVSTSHGILEAKKLGANYILKSRTDHRMYAPNIEEFLISTIDAFPITTTYSQKKRIVAVSLNTYLYRPYSISDMTLFGTLDDMQSYFDAPHDTREHFSFHDLSLKAWAKGRLCEGLLLTHFLEKMGRKLEFTLEDSWKVYAEHFCIIDSQAIGLFWYKYEYWNEYRVINYIALKNNQELNFREWLILYSNFPKKELIPEDVIDLEFGKTLAIR